MLAACFLIGALVPVGPWFDGTADFLDYLATLGTVIGGIATPIAIIAAYRIHVQSIEKPKRLHAEGTNDRLWKILKPLPENLTGFLTRAYSNVPMAIAKGPGEARQALLNIRQFHLITHRLGAQIYLLQSDIGQLEPEIRSAALDAMHALTPLDKGELEMHPDLSANELLLEIYMYEQVFSKAHICLCQLTPPHGEKLRDLTSEFFLLNEKRRLFFANENVQTFLQLPPTVGAPFDPLYPPSK
ncbi:MAG: hypothetical protein COA62_06605 [Rhodobiaceae bacterium]|nr:MAG: hypothetical protein COA62_06605 [Rhodobiaceae bacterium]